VNGILLDSNVISELRKPETRQDPVLSAWASRSDFRNTYISVVTIFEIEIGILRIKRHDSLQAKVLEQWFKEKVLSVYRGRILNITTDIARSAAALQTPDVHQISDAFIAATALCHNLTLATRNMKDFLNTGVRIVNPWDPDAPPLSFC